MLTKPLAFLCSSGEHWQRRAQLSYWLGRWIINFQISRFCLTAAALPQGKRSLPKPWHPSGAALSMGAWAWRCAFICMWMQPPSAGRTGSWTRSQHPGEGCWRMLEDAAASPAASMSKSEGWAGLKCSFVCVICLSYCHLKPGQSFFFLPEN